MPLPDPGMGDFIRRLFQQQSGGPPPPSPMTPLPAAAGPATPMGPAGPVPVPPLPNPGATPGAPPEAAAAKLLQSLLAKRGKKPAPAGAAMAPPPGLIGRR